MFSKILTWYLAWAFERRIRKLIPRPPKGSHTFAQEIAFKIQPWDLSNLDIDPSRPVLLGICRPNIRERADAFPIKRILQYWPNVVGCHDSEAKFLNLEANNEIERRTDIYIDISYTNKIPFVKLHEYEREALPQRVGSGITTSGLELCLTKGSFDYLIDQIFSIIDTEPLLSIHEHQLTLLFVIPCERIDIPAGRKIVPDSKIDKPFIWKKNLSEIRCLLMSLNTNGKINDVGDGYSVFGDIKNNFDLLKAWLFKFDS